MANGLSPSSSSSRAPPSRSNSTATNNGTAPRAGAGTDETQSVASGVVQVYARARPWIDKESTIPAEGQIVARPVLALEPTAPDTLVTLDPAVKFKPKKEFPLSKVFWSPPDGSAEGEAVPVATQETVHETIGAQMAQSICKGHSTACVVCGDSKTGKALTLFGDLSGKAPENRGLVPRFADEAFDQIQKTKPANSSTFVEVEILDVEDGNMMSDLLSKAGTGKPMSARSAPEEILKLREDNEAVTVQGVNKCQAESGAGIVQLVRQGLLRAKKRGGFGHVLITIRFIETLSFQDPSDPAAKITKRGKCTAQFLLLSGRPTAFFRCVDAASQRDKNESIKIPTRESTLTRLMRDFFNGNCAGHMVCCVSPFHGNLKETLTMLDMASKMRTVRWTTKTDFDQQTGQFRRLDDEMKQLKTKLSQSEQAQQVVQTELNRRQTLLEDVIGRNEEHKTLLDDAKETESAEFAGVAVQTMRFKRDDKRAREEQKIVEMEVNDASDRCDALDREAKGYEAEIDAVNERTAKENAKVQHFLDEEDELERQIAAFEKRQQECAEIVKIQEELLAEQIKQEEAELAELQRELEAVNDELDEAEKADEAMAAPIAKAEADHKTAMIPSNELEDAEKKKRALEEEEATLRAEIKQLEEDIERLERANKVDAGCCVIM